MGTIDRRRIFAQKRFGSGETGYSGLFDQLFSPFLFIRRRAEDLLIVQGI